MKWLAAIALTLGACGPSIPSPDVCDEGSTTTVSALQVGQADLDSVFSPWKDDAEVKLIFGAQGRAMLPLRVQLESSSSCLQTTLRLRSSVDPETSELLAEYIAPLSYYEQSNGALLSATHYLILGFGIEDYDSAILDVEVGGQSQSSPIQMVR